MGKVERALLLEERSPDHANTELLAYVEGFINDFKPLAGFLKQVLGFVP